MRADMLVGPLRINVVRGYKARALEAGDGQVLIQVALEDAPWPERVQRLKPFDQPPIEERVGFAGAALVVPAAKGVVRVVKAAKEAGVLQDGGGARGVVRKLREKFKARPGRVIKLRGPFSVAGCCAKCGGGGR